MAKPKAPKAPTKKLRKDWFKAYGNDDVAAITAHLDAGVNPDTLFQLDWEYPALASALERHRAPNIARLLLDRGADVKVAGPRGTTALHHVYDRAFAKELIARGADPDARDEYQRTPLHTACSNKQLAVVEELVAAGANPNAVDRRERTPYQTANDVAIRAHLREKGAKVIGPGGGHAIKAIELNGCAKSEVKGDRGALGLDREGNVWVWGYTGFFRIEPGNVRRHDFDESFAVTEVVAGPPGTVYFATNWGLLRATGTEWWLYNSEDSELFDNHLLFATASPDGKLVYMISYESEAEDKHVTVFDGETFSVLSPGKDLPLGIELQRIAFDRNGELMLCGRGGFAYKRAGEWVVMRRFEEKGFEATVYDALDDGEALWVGTQSGVYELRGDTTTKHDVKKLAKYLCKDGDALWVGTYFGGLARIRDGEVTIFDEKNSALPHDDIASVVRGHDGTIWVLTSQGVATVEGGELTRFE